MKRIFFSATLLLFLLTSLTQAQQIRDFKIATPAIAVERTQMLDAARMDIRRKINQEVVFIVNHFKVSGSYAWFTGEVVRKDGKNIVFPDDYYDCCHVEVLFKKVNGKWKVEQGGYFSTDMWYICIQNVVPKAAHGIFSDELLAMCPS